LHVTGGKPSGDGIPAHKAAARAQPPHGNDMVSDNDLIVVRDHLERWSRPGHSLSLAGLPLGGLDYKPVSIAIRHWIGDGNPGEPTLAGRHRGYKSRLVPPGS
jgi:hypothetical protein